MKYEKPEVAVLTAAVEAIQTPTRKEMLPADRVAAVGTGPGYDADE